MMESDTCILVVDDKKEITDAIRRLLSRQYNVVVANTVEEVKRKLLENEYSVIILDFDLQDEVEDGVTLSNLVHKHNQFSEIILLTGNLEYQTIKRALNEGKISYFINKPLDGAELRKKVNEAYTVYMERMKVTNILRSPDDMSKISLFMTDVFKPLPRDDSKIKLLGVFIAVDSIPIFSRFNQDFIVQSEDANIPESEYGTLFSSFLSALVTLGLEAFTNKEGAHLNGFKLHNYQFVFRFDGNYQFTYLFYSSGDQDMNAFDSLIESLHTWVLRKISVLQPTRYKFLDDADLNHFITSYFV